jgi:predicted nucleotidyltransferase
MLDSLITSKTRVKLLLKFFSNKQSKAYLRSLAEEFGESTNAVRLELNNLSQAGYLLSKENGRTIEYNANTRHPLYPELKKLVHKYLGLENIVENVIKKLGNVELAFITGDYAKGKDSGIIDLVIVGEINEHNLQQLVDKAELAIKRKIRSLVLTFEEYQALNKTLNPEKALWLWKVDTK